MRYYICMVTQKSDALTSRLSVLFATSTRKKIQTESKSSDITAGEFVRRAVLAYLAGKGSK